MMALPSNAPTALKNLTRMVDDMWYYAGDRSTYVNIICFSFRQRNETLRAVLCICAYCECIDVRLGE